MNNIITREQAEALGEWIAVKDVSEGDILWLEGHRCIVEVVHNVMFGRLRAMTLVSIEGDGDGGHGVYRPSDMVFKASNKDNPVDLVVHEIFEQPDANNSVHWHSVGEYEEIEENF